MAILSTVLLVLAIIVAVIFSLLVLITGKGDAMSGGGSVRTSYKGKATFDDIMSQAALYLGIAFMALVLLYNVVSTRVKTASMMPTPPARQAIVPPTSAPTNNAPASNAPASNAPASNNAPVASNGPAANSPAANAPASNAPATNAPATSSPAANNAPAGANNSGK